MLIPPLYRQRCLLPGGVIMLLLIVCTFRVYGQTKLDPAYLSVSDGLASPTVHDILQDSYGLMWFATGNGLQKYDGYSFQIFKNKAGVTSSIGDNDVWGVTEDRQHNLWVSHGAGVAKFDRKRSEFRNYNFGRIFNFKADVKSIAFRTFIDSQGRLWAGTRNVELVLYDSIADTWISAPYDVPGLDPRISHSGITLAIAEDSKGGLWSSSSAFGLMHFPKGGAGFKQIEFKDFAGFPFGGNNQNTITALYVDERNLVWITAQEGVYQYNPETGAVKTIKQYNEGGGDNATFLNEIVRDAEGNLWIPNNFRGILKFKNNSDDYEELIVNGKVKVPGRGWNISLTGLTIDRSGIFWFASFESGIVKYDPVNKPFSFLAHNDANPKSLSSNGVFGAAASRLRPGVIYVGTRGSGVNIYDPATGGFDKVTFKAVDDRFGGSARSIAEGDDGALWVGSWGDGLIKLDRTFHEVARYKYAPQDAASISGNLVRVIRRDNNGKLWIGTDSGLNLFDPATGKFERIDSRDTRHYPATLVDEVQTLIKTDARVGIIDQVKNVENRTVPVEIKEAGNYLVVVSGEGDYVSPADFGWIENTRKDTVWTFPSYEKTFHTGGAAKNRLVIDRVKLEAGSYLLRYKTDDSHAFDSWNEAAPDQLELYGIALVKIESKEQEASINKAFVRDDKEVYIIGSNISDIELAGQYVWISAAGNGLSRIDPVAKTVDNFSYSEGDVGSISSNTVYDVLSDSQGTIWLATEQGINKFDATNHKFIRYTEADGLPTNVTTNILEGDNGEMWIATQNGISQMVPNEKLGKVTFINYNSTDGLGGDIFLQLTSAKGSDGRFYFGGDHGLTTFKSVTANTTPPAVVFSNLFVSNRSVLDADGQALLPEGLMNANRIELQYDQDNLSFEFAALHYANPRKNQYAHMLKGYDKDWIYDNRNFASYTNLDPGEYDFMIRASNAYGIWNEEGRTIHISILPPWWQTWWAYTAYVLIFGLAIYVGDRAIRRSIKLRERERSREKELKQAREIEKAYAHLKETQAQLVQSEKMASLGELTAGIAHEIQNPLNFVNNFAEINKELIEEMKQEITSGNLEEVKVLAQNIAENENKINFHGKRADAIVKGMLQHSRSSSGLKEPTDINTIADEYLRLAYHGLRAKDKTFNATMKTNFDAGIGKINAVPQDIGRVILNLITNAFYVVAEKRTQLNGQMVDGIKYEPTVTVSTRKLPNKVEIRVTDNGSGIPQAVIDKIFQPFFTTKPSGQGTGLGLSMSYEIITKGHGGELKVETQVGQGTTFIIVLPN